jgi:L-alanine-DL-glutamate epimerase-like enolase superfamily enzyme
MSNSIIGSVEVYKLLIPLKEPFVISLGPVNNAENVVVIIKTKNGCIGYGECSPYTMINGETIDTCFIVARYLAKALIGADALKTEECSLVLDKTIYGNSSIKSAFDMAINDIAAQQQGIPLYKYLGGENNKVIETDMTVGIGSPAKMQADAIRFKDGGFPAIKVKLGETLEADVERIKKIREGIGNNIPLRIDANQGWPDPAYAITVLKALNEYNIEHCEEPIPRWQFMELNKVSAASPIPIMADESCCDEHDAERLLQLNACKMFNIKLGKSSGFYKAMKIVKLAEKANMHLQIGSFMESRLGLTASAHLALSSPNIIHYDFDTALMFSADPVMGGIEYKEKGVIEVPGVPGLGATIDDSYLKGAEKFII